jgi:hypothetical protein
MTTRTSSGRDTSSSDHAARWKNRSYVTRCRAACPSNFSPTVSTRLVTAGRDRHSTHPAAKCRNVTSVGAVNAGASC